MRLFVAAVVPEETKDAIFHCVSPLRGFFPNIRWEQKEKFHVTLRFLGDVEKSRIEVLSSCIGSVAYDCDCVESALEGFCLFPAPRNPRVLAMGLVSSAAFQFLFDKVQDAVVQKGFEMEKRKFTPHVTIGRIRGNFKGSFKLPAVDPMKVSIAKISLVRSELGPRGSRYEALGEWDLRGGI